MMEWHDRTAHRQTNCLSWNAHLQPQLSRLISHM
jgi:hypothetical protein